MRSSSTSSLAVLLALWAGAAQAQCAGGLIANCPRAVAPQPTDLVLGAQSGHTRSFTLQQLQAGGAIDLKATCGATGDGVADDSGPLKTCIAAVNASYAAGKPVVLHIPAGIYLIPNTNGTMPAFSPGVPGKVIGDGPHKTYIVLASNYAGDLFAWSEAWVTTRYSGPGPIVPGDTAGPSAIGLTITGSTAAPVQQNAFRFYDRNDFILMRDIEVYFLNGQCLSIGRALNQPEAYAREGSFWNIKCWNTGTATQAAVQISSTTASGSDATNELEFYQLHLFASTGAGLVISNPKTFSATRLLNFFGLRVEQSGNDNIDIGLPTDGGSVGLISIYGLESISPPTGYFALHIGQGNASSVPYDIAVVGGEIGPGAGGGIDIETGQRISIQLGDITTTQTNLTVGDHVSGPINLDGQGQELGWTTSISSGATPFVWFPTRSKPNGALFPVQTTVAGLPTCNGFTQYEIFLVTDAAAPTYGATLTGGSTVKALALCDGTNWKAH